MLGWLILFTFLTGAFAGSTLLLGVCIVLTQRDERNSETKSNLEAHDEALLNGDPTVQNTILSYKD